MAEGADAQVTAVVLAAGLSTRMGGHAKPLLPFGRGTVIEHIVAELEGAVQDIVVVTGHSGHDVTRQLAGRPARTVLNIAYANGEMLSSIQYGLRSVPANCDGALIVLGDQPGLARDVVDAVVAAFRAGRGSVVIPSYQMRRGHPILIGRQHWDAIARLDGQTLRDFMRSVAGEICHVPVDTPAILRDMDTPEEYRRELALIGQESVETGR